jgi:cysteine desulfurase
MINKKIYLDYAATTPVDPRVIKVMLPYFTKKFGNTMSLHSFGQEAKGVLEQSRGKVADLIGVKPEEIIFTSSATESNNLALKGVALAYMGFNNDGNFSKNDKGKLACQNIKDKAGHIIISSIEHACVSESAKWLEIQGFKITKIKVDKYGLVNPEDIKKEIRKNTILVSVMYANNEIGTIQPIEEISKICRAKKVFFHTDAAQSFGKIPIDVNKMNIDLLTASSHKMYGPKGVACLYVRDGIKLVPILHGGGHELGLRPSTINLPAIIGFAKACEICKREMKEEAKRLTKLRDKLINRVLKIKGSYLNGHAKKRLSNNVNFSFPFVEGESIVIQLDLLDVAVSTGSACSSTKLEPSHVLLAIGLKPEQAHGSLRLTLGRWTTEKEIDHVLKILPEIVKKFRKISPFKMY